jgi:hypothetical protein
MKRRPPPEQQEQQEVAKRQQQSTAAAAPSFVDNFMVVQSQVLAASAMDSHTSSSSSSSPLNEAKLKDAERYLDGYIPPTDDAAHPIDSEDVTITCETYTCVGGKWFGGTSFEPCVLRKQSHGVRHLKSMVCTLHHVFVKCNLCTAHVHEGCHAPAPSGFSLPQRNVPWKCLECTLKTQPGPPALDTKKEEDSDDSVKTKSESKCMFGSKVELQETLRQMNWKIRSGKRTSIICQCAAGARGASVCKQSFTAKCVDDDTHGMWCAINMPSVHQCGGQPAPMHVASRVCNLPINVYKEIQSLACCKAFKPASIQQFIKEKHGIIVDTTLIYNIGYRARSKLGIGDIEQLLSQQKVTVYTFSTFTHFNVIHSQARRELGDIFEFVHQQVDGEPRLK